MNLLYKHILFAGALLILVAYLFFFIGYVYDFYQGTTLRTTNTFNTLPRHTLRNLGPFFRGEKLTSDPMFVFRYCQNGKWSPWRNSENEHFRAYHAQLFGLSRLKQGRFERSLNLQLRNSTDSPSGAYQALQAYLHDQYFSLLTIDTVQIATMRIRPGSLPDTVKTFTYTPAYRP